MAFPTAHRPLLDAGRLAPGLLTLLLAGCVARTGGPTDPRDLPAYTPTEVAEMRVGADDGTILAVIDVGVVRSWEDLDEARRARFDEGEWEDARSNLRGRAELVTYSSDGLRVGALLVRPESVDGRRLPVVVLNRDGVANRGLDEDALLVELARFAREGFVAVASAYRGNRLSQGVDRFGGADVGDVLDLVRVVRRLDYADPARVYMVGRGRGGLMTYRALEEGASVRAAAVISAPCDAFELVEARPELVRGWESDGGWPGLADLTGDWERERLPILELRSPLARGEAFETPLLLVHGRDDEEVPVKQALCMASRLRKAERVFELVVFGYGDHALLEQRDEVHRRVLDWFARHGAKSLLH